MTYRFHLGGRHDDSRCMIDGENIFQLCEKQALVVPGNDVLTPCSGRMYIPLNFQLIAFTQTWEWQHLTQSGFAQRAIKWFGKTRRPCRPSKLMSELVIAALISYYDVVDTSFQLNMGHIVYIFEMQFVQLNNEWLIALLGSFLNLGRIFISVSDRDIFCLKVGC